MAPIKSKKTTTKKLKPIYHPLVLYNLLSGLIWGYHLYNTLFLYPKIGQPQFYFETNKSLTIIQTFAVIEILNSLFGFVRSPLTTTVAQVSSRLLIVWGIFQVLPNSPATNTNKIIYVTLSLAWSITEVVRYLYYFFNLIQPAPPFILSLLRYNLFWILYPTGVGSELLIIYYSLNEAAQNISYVYKYFLIFSMLSYIPGFPVLFIHMIHQRKKVMKQLFAKNQDGLNKKKN
ncbi:related to Very-long-chain (3R)-3-hydroxyacyl-[acyl-carrier protein] dehydratase PHS1 [Saccharomycodes ludwigii]|uniref:Very-long-chain (3R)-3-hydroxyacyl-CoA dehydratase n=1 Tax=Saccharomycodes ludwigii TaxID=36035 RepID=A0A376B9H4_9ASCO|nr:related to Very-long-chain (3R)-3-hydroxyacyl-[acyl-carrier protein] dehydratase PHS1 [Saccharomycodes ludwigii]